MWRAGQKRALLLLETAHASAALPLNDHLWLQWQIFKSKKKNHAHTPFPPIEMFAFPFLYFLFNPLAGT